MNGALVIDKPAGLTSHDVVARVRNLLHVRRVGHTGTLDPFATGVLVVLVGRATRLAQFLSGLEKEYEAVIRLGFSTDTGDKTGKPLDNPNTKSNSAQGWTETEIETALKSLRGDIDQVPPMYSAKKVDGRKLYELARRGEEVERKPVRVCIYQFEPIKPDGKLLKDNLDGTFDFEVRVSCSAGTYVRTLAEDLGKRLQVGAHLAELRRTRVGDLVIPQARTLEEIKTAFAEEALGQVMLTPDDLLARLPVVDLGADDARRVRHGLDVNVSAPNLNDGDRARLRDEHRHLVAVATYEAEAKLLHASVVIAPEEG